MSKRKYPFVHQQYSRLGVAIWYFRKDKGKRTRLKGDYDSEEFQASYAAALAGSADDKQKASKNTMTWLVEQYKKSSAFKGLKPSTQKMRENILKQAMANGGKVLVSQVSREKIAAGRDRRADTPFAAINYLKVMGYLFEWAVDAGHARFNPARGVKPPKVRTEGHAPWSEDDIIAFYRQHAAGSQARLAMEILMFTGLRRSDAYLLGPQHIKDDVIEFRATKNNEQLFIALHPILKQSLAEVKSGHLAYLVTPIHGRPFRSAASFGNWFGAMCAEAGVSSRAHGIRKSVAQKLAEAGGSNSELKALFGWNSDAMASLYTRKADRRKMAASASKKLSENEFDPRILSEFPRIEKND